MILQTITNSFGNCGRNFRNTEIMQNNGPILNIFGKLRFVFFVFSENLKYQIKN